MTSESKVVICPRGFMTWSSVQHMDKFSLCVCVCVCVRALELYMIITALNWGIVLSCAKFSNDQNTTMQQVTR